MKNKSTSVLGPFFLTFAGVLALGLLAMYYGFYQGRISRYEDYIAELQNQPEPEINLSFQVDDSGVTRGESASSETTSVAESSTGEESSETQRASAAGSGSSEVEKPVNPGACGSTRTKAARPVAKKAPRPAEKSKVNTAGDRSGTQVEDDEDINRGPAYPSSRTREDEAEEMAESGDRRDIPDINDPELDDNPLIRALREASRRQDEGGGADDERSDPPKNPFEAILNTQGN
ncbi:MAG TPA: hypothetical protein PLV45_13380 [bacterium]|nr:hypothetical protein [bacterium]